jgi:hypothetical protein
MKYPEFASTKNATIEPSGTVIPLTIEGEKA